MSYIIDETNNIPAYLQLYKYVREDIVAKIYPFGSKLPSKRTLAAESGISTVTVEHAYALLSDEGYIESRERSGYFVIFCADDSFAFPISSAVSPVLPAANHSDTSLQFPFSVLSKTMRSVMSTRGESILDRPPNSGCLELREAISLYLARSRGINACPEQVFIGSGSEYLYTLVVELLGRDRIYAIEAPSYKKIEQVYRAADVRCDMLPLGNDGIKTSALRKTKADIMHVSPYRSFPSNITATASKRHEYLRWAHKTGRYIIEDDFESEFSVSKKPEETLFSHSEDDNIIYMNTFSKTISPSLRVGYMVLPKHLVPVFEEKLGFYSCTVPTFIQYILAELISNGDFERHINRVRRQKRREISKNT